MRWPVRPGCVESAIRPARSFDEPGRSAEIERDDEAPLTPGAGVGENVIFGHERRPVADRQGGLAPAQLEQRARERQHGGGSRRCASTLCSA